MSYLSLEDYNSFIDVANNSDILEELLTKQQELGYSFDHLLRKADLSFCKRQYQTALSMYCDYFVNNPEFQQNYQGWGNRILIEGVYQHMPAKWYIQKISNDSNIESTLNAIGLLISQIRDQQFCIDKIKKMLENISEQNPNYKNILCLQAHAYFNANNIQEAKKLYENCGEHKNAYVGLGLLFSQENSMRDLKKAKQYFENALNPDGNNVFAYLGLLSICKSSEREQICNQPSLKNIAKVLSMQGKILQKKGQYSQALQKYRLAVQQNQFYSLPYYQSGRIVLKNPQIFRSSAQNIQKNPHKKTASVQIQTTEKLVSIQQVKKIKFQYDRLLLKIDEYDKYRDDKKIRQKQRIKKLKEKLVEKDKKEKQLNAQIKHIQNQLSLFRQEMVKMVGQIKLKEQKYAGLEKELNTKCQIINFKNSQILSLQEKMKQLFFQVNETLQGGNFDQKQVVNNFIKKNSLCEQIMESNSSNDATMEYIIDLWNKNEQIREQKIRYEQILGKIAEKQRLTLEDLMNNFEETEQMEEQEKLDEKEENE